MFDTLIAGGTVATVDGISEADIGVTDAAFPPSEQAWPGTQRLPGKSTHQDCWYCQAGSTYTPTSRPALANSGPPMTSKAGPGRQRLAVSRLS